VCLRDRDDQERPAVLLEGAANDRLPISQPRPMDDRTPAAAAVARLARDDLSAASAKLAIVRQRRRPNPGDDLFRSPERGPLLV
jgi:hypothetical protein